MPLRITIELIPHGDESRKEIVAIVEADNDGTGTQAAGNYNVSIIGPVHGGGLDLWADVPAKVHGVVRDHGFFAQACGTLAQLQQIKTEQIIS